MFGATATILTLLAPLTPASPPAAHTLPAPAPPAETVQLDIMTASGSGCPAGSVTARTLPDNSGFILNYLGYQAMTGPDARPVDARKNCQIALRLDSPPGYRYAIFGVDFAGSARVAKGATAQIRANLYTAGMSPTEYATRTIAGPVDEAWTWSDHADLGPTYLPCGERHILNINTELRINRGSSDPAETSTISFTPPGAPPAGAPLAAPPLAGASSKYHLGWIPCPETPR